MAVCGCGILPVAAVVPVPGISYHVMSSYRRYISGPLVVGV